MYTLDQITKFLEYYNSEQRKEKFKNSDSDVPIEERLKEFTDSDKEWLEGIEPEGVIFGVYGKEEGKATAIMMGNNRTNTNGF